MRSHAEGSLTRVRIRPFADGDYPRAVEIHTLVYPSAPTTEAEERYYDRVWDTTRFARYRTVAEDAGGRVVAVGRYNHVPDEFHPEKYAVDIAVDPACRRRGVGGALYAHLIALLRAHGAIAARAGVPNEEDAESLGFLARRGFVETHRGWQSRLDVAGFAFGRFATAEPRVAARGIAITTLGAETVRGPQALRGVYELTTACERDVPSADPVTPVPFDLFVAHTVASPNYLADAFFLAKDGDRYVGLSALWRLYAAPDVLQQGLTGVLPAYRGRGIALALKLQTVRFAQATGARQIWTWNDSRNRPMLRINEAMGFVKQPASVGLEKPLREGPGNPGAETSPAGIPHGPRQAL